MLSYFLSNYLSIDISELLKFPIIATAKFALYIC